MKNFGERVDIVKLKKVENIHYVKKINFSVFFGAVLYMTFFVMSIFCLYSIFHSLWVVL